MSDEKYDLEKGLKAMRYVAKMLNTWADDLEACAGKDRAVQRAGHASDGFHAQTAAIADILRSVTIQAAYISVPIMSGMNKL